MFFVVGQLQMACVIFSTAGYEIKQVSSYTTANDDELKVWRMPSACHKHLNFIQLAYAANCCFNIVHSFVPIFLDLAFTFLRCVSRSHKIQQKKKVEEITRGRIENEKSMRGTSNAYNERDLISERCFFIYFQNKFSFHRRTGVVWPLADMRKWRINNG